jgi:hypothetical protein
LLGDNDLLRHKGRELELCGALGASLGSLRWLRRRTIPAAGSEHGFECWRRRNGEAISHAIRADQRPSAGWNNED